MSIIKLVGINKSFPMGDTRQQVLFDLNLQIKQSDMLAIMGESGSGKSTLMNIIGLLDRPDNGSYYLNDKEISSSKDDDLARLRNQTIGFVFQQFFLLPRLTAEQNVALPLSYRGTPNAETKQRVSEMLEKVGMSHRSHHRPNQLSGGQQQRVAIARALVGNPSIILADEPTGALDSKTSQEVMDLFLALNQTENRTIIIVTHDHHVGDLCKSRISMRDGVIVDEN